MADLTEADRIIISQCMLASSDGPFFPEWEFSTLFGLERKQLRTIAEQWPTVDESDEDVKLAVTNSLGNLLGYPHGKDALWNGHINVSRDEVMRTLDRWLQKR